MLRLEVTATGKTWGDLEEAVSELLEKVRGGYLSGANSNDTGSFEFVVSGESEELVDALDAEELDGQDLAEERERLIQAWENSFPDASFFPYCPKCNGDVLLVTAVTLEYNGERVHVGEHLGPYGFLVPLSAEVKNQSTSDERVVCVMCKHDFDLSEVTQ
jgi:hypothetical protein